MPTVGVHPPACRGNRTLRLIGLLIDDHISPRFIRCFGTKRPAEAEQPARPCPRPSRSHRVTKAAKPRKAHPPARGRPESPVRRRLALVNRPEGDDDRVSVAPTSRQPPVSPAGASGVGVATESSQVPGVSITRGWRVPWSVRTAAPKEEAVGVESGLRRPTRCGEKMRLRAGGAAGRPRPGRCRSPGFGTDEEISDGVVRNVAGGTESATSRRQR